jgi:nicotinamidase-related amidase
MELSLDPATTALVMVDLQSGIARETAPHAAADVVGRAAAMARALRSAGGTIVWVRVDNHPDGRDRLRPITDTAGAERSRAPDHAELMPGLDRDPADLVMTKRGWSAFHGTELDLQLRRRDVRTIVLGGISTNVGVETTARAAYDHGYQQIFVEDAMASRDAAEHAWTVGHVFPRIGRVRSTADVLAALGRDRRAPAAALVPASPREVRDA